MKVALLFPGQGAQEVGMGRAMAHASEEARAVFAEADLALAPELPSLSSLCFEGPADVLTLTANTQPAILATSVACLAALRARVPSLAPALVAGHSLGEYSALVAAGALTLPDALRLLRVRGRAMQDAVAPGDGAMAAVMGLSDDQVRDLCAGVEADMPGRVVSAANFNCPGQVVVAGHSDAVSSLRARAAESSAKTMALQVSAPFHCALMAPAAARLAEALVDVEVRAPSVPVVANVDASPNADPARVKDLLVRQVAGTVRWGDCVRAMLDAGVDTFVEVGVGRVLSGLVRRVQRGVAVHAVSDPASLEATARALGG